MTKFGGFRSFHLAHLSVVFTESRSYFLYRPVTQRGVAAIEVTELLTHNYVEGEPITAETACLIHVNVE